MNGGATANKELIDFFYDALEHKNDALDANMPAARPWAANFKNPSPWPSCRQSMAAIDMRGAAWGWLSRWR